MRLRSALLLLVACGGGEPLPMPMTMMPEPDAGPVVSRDVEVKTLPCDVAVVLSKHCASCHSSPPTNNAPMPLLTRADLIAPFAGDATVTVAQRSLLRMRATVGMMPPSGQAPEADVNAFAAWVEAGALPGSCSATPEPVTQTCASGRHWTQGNRSRDLMNPGEACVACHVKNRVNELFSAAGTVYADLHADMLCVGSQKGVVEIIDRNGAVTTLTPNASGNFTTFANIAKPYTARVKVGTKVRTMSTPQTSGDCNSCHTTLGAEGAPGRIIWPD